MLLDDHGFIAPRLALADNRALMDPVAIIIAAARSDGYARSNWADTDANAYLFGARRQAP
jgi:hypothetical protein